MSVRKDATGAHCCTACDALARLCLSSTNASSGHHSDGAEYHNIQHVNPMGKVRRNGTQSLTATLLFYASLSQLLFTITDHHSSLR
jgi:hypothetical protein